ncbi:fructosamine deglycase FrlB [Mariniluteicoccus flavus]
MQDTMEMDVRAAASGETVETVRAFVVDSLRPSTRVIYLVGCGGSMFMFSAMRYLLDRSNIPAVCLNAEEFVNRKPSLVGPDSIVIASSTFGGTEETAHAIEWAQSEGAPVLLVCARADSVCGRVAHRMVGHRGVEAKQVLLAVIALELITAQGNRANGDATLAALADSGPAFRETNLHWRDRFSAAARDIVGATCVYVLASGPNEGAAQTFAACYLQEMQNQHAVPIGSNDFLHGTFEVIDGATPVVLMIGEDETASLGHRALRFLERYNKANHVFDAAELPLTGVEASARPLIGTLIYNSSLIAALAQGVESVSGAPLQGRRYMWKVEY